MTTDAIDAVAELEALAREIRVCVRCRLHENRTHGVPGEGPPDADLVLLGEGPGGMEDRTGRPFVGPAGRLLDSLLREIGLDRSRVFITNCVKCRPPENRTPRRDEVTICTGNWLYRQLDLITPRVVVLLGQVAIREMLGPKASVTALHGTVQRRSDRDFFVTYHPAAGLRFDPILTTLRGDFEILGRLLAASAETSPAE